MKNFFSLKNDFNIFTVIGFSIIFSCMSLPRDVATPLVLIGIFIGWIPDIYKSFITYKESKKISKLLRTILSLIFISLLIIFQFI